MTTLQKISITAALTATIGGGIYEARQNVLLRDQVQTLQQQQAPLEEQVEQMQVEHVSLTNRLAALRAENLNLKSNSQEMELLRLRSRVSTLGVQLQEARQQAAARAADVSTITAAPTQTATSQLTIEEQMRADHRHWVLTHEKVAVGSLVQGNYGILGAGGIGRVVSINTGQDGQQTALVDFGRNSTRTCDLSSLTAVSDVPASDSMEGALLTQGSRWYSDPGEIAVGAWVEDILDGRFDQPDGRGSIGKVVSLIQNEGQPPAAVVDFGRNYMPNIYLSEISRVRLAPR